MTLWHCAVEVGTEFDGGECSVPRAVGVLDCPECGTVRAPFRENGEGPIFDFVQTSEPRFAGDREAFGVRVRDVSGTEVGTEVPEREESDNAEDQS